MKHIVLAPSELEWDTYDNIVDWIRAYFPLHKRIKHNFIVVTSPNQEDIPIIIFTFETPY